MSSGVPIQAPKLVSKAFVVDKATMERIAKCESTNDPLARNKHSTAKGLYQFLDGSWVYYGKQLWGTIEGHDVFNADDNTELAYYVASKNGYTQDWGSSEYCWGDKILPINK